MDINAKGKCLTLLGISSVQSYVFASNRLRENAGASYLAWHAMEDWRDKWKEMGACAFLFAGGGNAVLLFETEGAAKESIGRWSRDYLERACGLRLTAAHALVDGTLQGAFSTAERKMERVENSPPHGCEFGALPVVRACPSTGLAASEFDRFSNCFSREAAGKRAAIAKANLRLQSDFACEGFAFPIELEELGTREGASQIAIVHADGNGVGRMRSAIVHEKKLDDQSFSKALVDFSADVNESASLAFRAVLHKLRAVLPRLEEEAGIETSLSKDGSRYFPLRPIVYGGDDLTFVCHGRLGLVLAALYLQEFAQSGDFTACAGVLIMPQKFPFARGYALAKELCISAKRKRKEHGNEGSWMDFHVLLEGATGSLQKLREFYQAADGRPLMRRPYRLDGWANCEKLWREFRNLPRNRAKRLLEVLARGKDDTQAFLANLPEQGKLPDAGDAAMKTSGWDADEMTSYFDPLELLDFHVDSRFFSDEGGRAHVAA
jgi:hypothetical protein